MSTESKRICLQNIYLVSRRLHQTKKNLFSMFVSSNWEALKSKGFHKGGDYPRKRVAVSTPTTKLQTRQKTSDSRMLAMDCEMVEGVTIEHMLARVSLVDYDGRVVYDAFVRPTEKVIDYRTAITGITAEVLGRKGEKFTVVRAKVMQLIEGKILVGHAIHHDFETLEMDRPEESLIRDTCLFPPLRPPNRKQTPSLKLLAEYWLDKQMQSGAHSSVEDARTTMILYKRFQADWEDHVANL